MIDPKLAFPFRLCGGPAHCRKLGIFGRYIINRNVEGTGFEASIYPVSLFKRKMGEWDNTPVLIGHEGRSPLIGYARGFSWSEDLQGVVGLLYPASDVTASDFMQRAIENTLSSQAVSGHYKVDAETFKHGGRWYKKVKDIDKLWSIDLVEVATAGGRLLSEVEYKLLT
ncbi:MAG: hypothetical protein KDJ52_15520 [Anaerolineae bacterium]|nr:hypothetical protein [Anaerolineae bacterium]